MPKKTRLWALLLLAFSTLSYWIPSSYRIDQNFELVGNFQSLKGIPDFVNELVFRDPYIHGECRTEGSVTSIHCEYSASRRTSAYRLAHDLSTNLPRNVGWITIENLELRSTEKKDLLSQLQTKTQDFDRKINAMAEMNLALKREVDRLHLSQANLEQEVENKKRQRDLLNEAVQKHEDATHLAMFQKKVAELSESLSHLENDVSVTRTQIEKISAPLNEEQKMRTERDQVNDEILHLQQQILNYSRILSSKDLTNPIRDPDNFQLSPKPESNVIRGVHHAKNFFSFLIFGLLLLASSLKRREPWRKPKVFSTSDEVMAQTGMAFLGQISYQALKSTLTQK